MGKALLAYSPREVLDRYLAQGVRSQTNSSITTADDLKAAIVKIHSTGYAVEANEVVIGVRCVGAPIFALDRAIASISVCGPVHQMTLKS